MIKGLKTREKIRPIVDVKIGANVPVGCRNHLIYAESPDDRKCVNIIDGQCPDYVKCKMSAKNEQQLESAGFKTRPIQLGYFLMPDHLRIQMGLPERPTEIPNICVISDHDLSLGLQEPLECLMRYPVFDYQLMWWRRTECVCRGDGEIAHWFPFSADNEHHMKQRACAFRECPDYVAKGKCKPYGELYFAIPGAPGFPGLWRIATRSMNSINDIIDGLTMLHAGLMGAVSRIPLTLSIREREAHPIVDGKRITTTINTLRLDSNVTAMGAAKARAQIMEALKQVGCGVRLLGVPEKAPLPTPPVEELATADPSEWDKDVIDSTATEISDEQAKPAATPTAPASPPASKPKPSDAHPSEDVCKACGGTGESSKGGRCAPCSGRGSVVKTTPAAKPTAQAKPNADSEAAKRVAALKTAAEIEDSVVAGLEACTCIPELAAYFKAHAGDFEEYKVYGFSPDKARETVARLKATLPKEKPTATQPKPSAPTKPAKPAVQKAAPEGSAPSKGPNRSKLDMAISVGKTDAEKVIETINMYRQSVQVPGEVKVLDDMTEDECKVILGLL